MLTLNRKPSTLAQTLNPDAWRNIAECAGARARLIPNDQTDRITAEYGSASVGWDQCRLARDPFPLIVEEGIVFYGAEPTVDNLSLDRSWHLSQSLGDNPATVPDYLSEAMCDEPTGWQDTVCRYLQATDDRGREFSWQPLTVSGEHDLTGDVFAVVFYPADSADYLWARDCRVSVDGELYDISDSTIADCSILDSRLGWWIADLHSGEYLAECESEHQCYSIGYYHDPTGELRRDLIGEPAWHHGLGCFVGRLRYWPEPVRIHPVVPSYGG